MDKAIEAAAMEALPQLLGWSVRRVPVPNCDNVCVARKDLSLKDGQTLMAARCCRLVGHPMRVPGYLYVAFFTIVNENPLTHWMPR